MAEASEDIELNHRNYMNNTNESRTDGTQPSVLHASSLWNYMVKQENEKAKCKICNKVS